MCGRSVPQTVGEHSDFKHRLNNIPALLWPSAAARLRSDYGRCQRQRPRGVESVFVGAVQSVGVSLWLSLSIPFF